MVVTVVNAAGTLAADTSGVRKAAEGTGAGWSGKKIISERES